MRIGNVVEMLGYEIDTKTVEDMLGVRVVPTVSTKKGGCLIY